MTWSSGGLQLRPGNPPYSAGTSNNRFQSQDFNKLIMALRGNQIISGCGLSVGGTTDLTSAGTHLVVAAGSVIVAGIIKSVSSTNIDLSGAFNAMITGQARYVIIYVDSTGAVQTTNGNITTDGNQVDPEFPEDSVSIGKVYLASADTVMDSNQIFDERILVPSGFYTSGSIKNSVDNAGIYTGAANQTRLYFDGTDSILNHNAGSGNLNLQSGSISRVQITYNGNINVMNAGSITNTIAGIFKIQDKDDGNVDLFSFDTSARTFDVGASADPFNYNFYVNSYFILDLFSNGGALIFRKNYSGSPYNMGIIAYDDGDGSADALHISGYDGLTFFTGTNTYSATKARLGITDTTMTIGNSTEGLTVTLYNQLLLPKTGSTGGLVIGGDANLYRSAANMLKTDDSLTVGGNIISGQIDATYDSYTGYVGNFDNPNATSGFGIKIVLSGRTTVGATDRFISFRNKSGEVGYINNEVTYNTFTGGHASQNTNFNPKKWRKGMIVESTGLLVNKNTKSASMALPEIKICSSPQSEKVMGVYTGYTYDHELLGFTPDLPTIEYNALGEGQILVTNEYGDVQNGDYICSSPISGIGMKQKCNILHSYTVAKITENINWNDIEEDSELGIKVYLAACTYHCG